MKKMIARVAYCLPFYLFALSLQSHAQALTSEDIKAQMVKDWERAKAYTVDYLNTMPADKYSYKAVDSLRSFANQMLHLAAGNLFLMSQASDQKPPAFLQSDIEHSPGAQNKDSVMYYVTTSYDYCINAVKNSDVNKWGEKKKIFGFEETRFAMMNKVFEHQTHHRGQTTIYIRLNNVKPPQERLFAK
ncbi:MAG: damage-inducible protein DinB [Bacteroidetes bacterium]|nr:damage-inducible protein DinB [Bacteroidota bacterium]